MTPSPKNFTIASRPQWLRERFEAFRIWYTTQYLQLVYLGFFYIGDLRSGQFRDLPIISQWGKTQMPQILIRSAQLVQNHAQFGYCWWPRCNFAYVTPGKVIWGQIMTSWGQCTLLPKLLNEMRYRPGVGFKMFLLSRHIKWYATWHSLVTFWPWPEVKKWSWPFEVTVYTVRLVSTRQTRWYLYYCRTYNNEKLFAVKYFAQKQLFWLRWPMEAKPLTLGQTWRNLSDGEFNSLLNAVFGFALATIVPEITEVFRNNV